MAHIHTYMKRAYTVLLLSNMPAFGSPHPCLIQAAAGALVNSHGGMQALVKSFLTTEMPPLRRIAQLTPRYSGSDLVEICKQAARHCVLEHIKRSKPPAATAATTGGGASSSAIKTGQDGNNANQGLPKRGGLSMDALYSLMQWPSSQPQAEPSKSTGVKALPDGNGTVMHDGEEYGDADASAPVEVAKVSPEAQLTEVALIKCVAEVRECAVAWWSAVQRRCLFRKILCLTYAGSLALLSTPCTSVSGGVISCDPACKRHMYCC